ncbi:uncharacterized protein Z520_09580 [Fonsecaea multimorphosa CBS 102226]|uniref:Uncharacterized protein n=1 Tax=Fonsecaea multimorphosa CBS 102226 TaxID=1442371 RepID=A0A0D2GZE1_9EURO|nr:uncharacterized protein Z520_09580 [Fonsecaea multimorphosa CBS 102226]KIX94890.1 hypothetical protein Z520_09580 [Fonsecaea multimorphosa CBS 102226]
MSSPVNGTHAWPRSSQGEGGVELGPNDGAALISKTGLPYRLSEHRKNWATWFAFFCFDGCVLPIILFYSLWYGSTLTHWTIFTLITSLSFWTSYHKWFSRGYRLLIKRDPKYRPINGGRWWFDCSYYILSLALLIVIVELVAATATKDVKVKVIAMAPPSVLYTIGGYMLLQNTAHCLRIRTFVTLSSVKRGSLTPPPLFTVMEDVFAVDGCHLGLPARHAMLATYNASARFRNTLMWWSWIWCLACLAVAVGLSIVVGLVKGTTAFGITYGVSFPFIVFMSVVTAFWMESRDARGAFSAPVGQGKALRSVSVRNGRLA